MKRFLALTAVVGLCASAFLANADDRETIREANQTTDYYFTFSYTAPTDEYVYTNSATLSNGDRKLRHPWTLGSVAITYPTNGTQGFSIRVERDFYTSLYATNEIVTDAFGNTVTNDFSTSSTGTVVSTDSWLILTNVTTNALSVVYTDKDDIPYFPILGGDRVIFNFTDGDAQTNNLVINGKR